MSFITCPESSCLAHTQIYDLCPDDALLRLLWHFMNAHPERDALEMLDETRTENGDLIKV